MFKTQKEALDKLEAETRRDIRRLEDSYGNNLLDLWFKARIDVQSIIAQEYHADFHGEKWHLSSAGAKGTLYRIFQRSSARLLQFQQEAKAMIGEGLSSIYREEIARALWMLDATTPALRHPRWPAPAREAKSPRDYRSGWEDALSGWLDSYDDALRSNLRMEALHEGSLEDATDEVVSTRIDNSDPTTKFASLFTNQSLQAQADARKAVAAENDDMVLEEIWMTMEDARVCPVCDEYDGLPIAEVDDEIPAHFNCRCYTRIVPQEWAEMLRSGSPEDRETALKMDDAGLVPSAMAIRGKSGEIVAHATVKFDDWLMGRATDFYGSNIAGRAGTESMHSGGY